jgi:cobalt-zinc-cadmium efflux system membrane fusion protein
MGNDQTMKRILLPCFLLILAACGRPPAPEAAPAPRIEGERIAFAAQSPQLKALRSALPEVVTTETLRLNGRVVWDESRTVRVFAPLGGRVLRLSAVPGQTVKAGDVLAVIASPDFGQSQAELARAAADFAVADKALARARDLHGQGVIAEKDLQQAEADFQRAQAERQRTRVRARLYGGGESVQQDFVLRAPIAGTVVERNANPGQEIRPDQAQPGNPAMFVISDPSRLWVQLELAEAALADIRPGMDFRLHTPALGDEPVTGRIDWVADSLDAATRTTRARGSVANPARRLKAEMYVAADVEVQRGNFLRLPAGAVILLGSSQYVFIDAGGGAFVRRRVTAEEAGFGVVRIREGLAAGEKVVIDGALLLQQLLASGAP